MLEAESHLHLGPASEHGAQDSARDRPRLRAAFVQTVQIYGAGLPPGGLPNVDYLSRELQRQTDLTLGGPGGRLLLGTVMVN